MENSSSVLKLVHPGCFIEKYTKPITAAEVMRRHPRHCVARPDVFRNPWIVVRPESVLLPGSVFYVVSFHTLRHLMRSMPGPHKPVEGSSQSFADMADFRRLRKERPGQDSSAEMTNSMKTAVERLIRKRTSKEGYFGQDTISSRFCEETLDGSDRNHRVRKRMINDAILSAKQSDKNQYNCPVKKYLDRVGNSFSRTDHRYCDGLDNATELKSCLKKQKRELNHLRVRFKLPGEEEKIETNTVSENRKTTSTFI